MSECGNDEFDCENICEDDHCSVFYQIWQIFAGDAYYMNHSDVCNTVWSTALDFFGRDDPGDCEERVDAIDYDGDSVMNFREFTVLAMEGHNNFERDLQGPQVNCSMCVGLEYYNMKVYH